MPQALKDVIIADISAKNPTESITLRRNLGTGVFKDQNVEIDGVKKNQRVMQGVEYSSQENASFASNLGEDLIPKLKIDIDDVVYCREQLSFDHINLHLASERKKGKHCGVNEYFETFGFTNADGETYTMDDLLKKIGFNKNQHSLQFFVDTSIGDARRFLIPEVIRDVVFRAMLQTPRYQLLTGGRDIPISLPEAKLPELLYSGDEALMEDIGEAENLPEVTIDFSERTVKIFRRGIRVPINADVIKYVQFPVLERTLQQIGWRLGNQLSDLCILTMLNGDLPNNGYPAGVMGVENVGNKIVYYDITRLTTRYSQTAYRPNIVLANEAEVIRIKNHSDFKPSPNNSDPLFKYNDINGEMSSATMLPSDQIANDKQLWVDTARAISQLTLEGMSIENERHARTDQWEYYIRLATGFQNEDEQAKIILDGTQDFASVPFPSYMNLVK